jgi:hypothetical protein
MRAVPYDPGPPAVAAKMGHTWQVDFEACAGCHGSAANAQTMTSGVQTTTQTRLDGIAAALGDPATWEYVASGGPPTATDCAADPQCTFSQDDIPDDVKKVRFLYHYVVNDASLGVHNEDYTTAILDVAESLLPVKALASVGNRRVEATPVTTEPVSEFARAQAWVGRDLSDAWQRGAARRALRPALTVVPRTHLVRPGDLLVVDVFAHGLTDVRGYQLSLEARMDAPATTSASGETDPRLAVEAMWIDTDRPDYVFADVTSYPVVAETAERLASAALDQGVTLTGRAYLGTWSFRVSDRLRGDSRWEFVPGSESVLIDGAGARIPIDDVAAGESWVHDAKGRRRVR